MWSCPVIGNALDQHTGGSVRPPLGVPGMREGNMGVSAELSESMKSLMAVPGVAGSGAD